jgi:hypothetical protein
MNLPFTQEQFLNVFRHYNLSVWPMQIILVLFGLAALFFAIKRRPASGKLISAILAFFWLWMGIVYHLINFTAINKAAYGFGLLFIAEGLLLLYFGVLKASLSFRFNPDRYGWTGALFMLYALIIYPILGYLQGHAYPQAPTFGLPCPTTIFTFGLLLWADKKDSPFVFGIPFLWSIIGFTAAMKLGIKEDVGLLVAGVIGSILIIMKNKSFGHSE